MDTKSRKSNRGFARRFMAVLLLAVLLFINSFGFASLARELVLFGTAPATKAKEPFTHTTSFAAETQALMNYLAVAVSAESNGEISGDLLANRMAELQAQYAEEIVEYNAIVSDCSVCLAMQNSGVVPPVPAQDAPSTQQGYWYYKFIVSGYGDIESYAADVSGYDEYLGAVQGARVDYTGNDERILDFIHSIKTMKYFIVNNQTGAFITNIDSCTTKQQAEAAVKGSSWYAFGSKDSFGSNDTRSYSSAKGEDDFYSWMGFAPDCPSVYSGVELEKSNLVTVSPYYWFRDMHTGKNDFSLYLGYNTVASGKALAGATDGFATLDAEYSAYSFTKKDLIVMASLAIICLIIFVYLISTTGKQPDGTYKKYFIDRLWNDVHLFLTLSACGALGTLAVWICVTMMVTAVSSLTFFAAVCAACFTLIVLFIIEWLASVARHVKAKTFLRHTFCWKFVALCLKPFVLLFRHCKELILVKNMPKWTAVVFGAALGMNLLLALIAAGSNSAFPVFLMFILDTVLLAMFVKAFTSLSKIMKTVEEAKNGNPSAKVDVSKTFVLYRDFAGNVNTVNDGIAAAVDSAVRDQKTKTELITNVSHDLKTPLTSIVTYVDLLKRCGIEGEEANKYIDILDEKSQRLKKLVEDLVEASKVSSGAVELHPVKLNLCELAVQAVGENCEILEKDGIETFYNTPSAPVFIMADGQKTSRVIENLFSNVCKYAMPGTRVYVDVTANGRFGALTIKNVSKYPLNISAEELKQRFVRGDESRTSEGSGLGLSIAQNLCTLQGGGCDIEIDGDLFKATVYFPQVQ